jgi:meso-butanediol dehydrogenase/(S,S)-butanediol dehydrogenase/diacetyl reductase
MDLPYDDVGVHEGRVVVVTGAASGIGRATVDRLVKEGAKVVAADLDVKGLDDLSGLSNVVAIVCDAKSEQANGRAVQAGIEAFGRVDGAFLNAGMPMSGDLIELSLDDFERTMELNVSGVLLGIRAAVPAIREAGGGSIVVTGSTSGLAADPNHWAYNTSKAAVINLVRSAALDLASEAIRVNAVCPGPTNTAMTAAFDRQPERKARLERHIPMQRFASADEIAAVASFLLSDEASFVTGVALPVDGGIGANTGQFLPRARD